MTENDVLIKPNSCSHCSHIIMYRIILNNVFSYTAIQCQTLIH